MQSLGGHCPHFLLTVSKGAQSAGSHCPPFHFSRSKATQSVNGPPLHFLLSVLTQCRAWTVLVHPFFLPTTYIIPLRVNPNELHDFLRLPSQVQCFFNRIPPKRLNHPIFPFLLYFVHVNTRWFFFRLPLLLYNGTAISPSFFCD